MVRHKDTRMTNTTNRLRPGKAYEHTIFGLLTVEGFDVYHPIVDDQAIDGIIRVRGEGAELPRYFELQVKGSKTWGGIRCKVQKLTKQGVLILYCAAEREILWFLYEELATLFPARNPDWGDIFLNKENVAKYKLEGRDKPAELLKRL